MAPPACPRTAMPDGHRGTARTGRSCLSENLSPDVTL